MLVNSPKFEAGGYRDARPLYPRVLFRPLEAALRGSAPFFLDLACGTGQSTRSFLDLGITRSGFAVDADPAMVASANANLSHGFPEMRIRVGEAEALPLEDESVGLVLVGSAIHWFDLTRARSEIERVLHPGGFLFVFEYQFPKCLDHPELAETIRRRFNLEWKAPVQKPRGTLGELVGPFRDSAHWTLISDERPEWTESLSLESFLGHLYSQSRYLHAEAAAPDAEEYRKTIASFFTPYFAADPLRFDMKPRVILLKKKR